MAQKTKTELRKTDFLVIRSQRNDDILKIVTPQNYQIGLDDTDFEKTLDVKGVINATKKIESLTKILSPALSGSLTTLPDGTAYLRAGANVTISSGSVDGSSVDYITIAAGGFSANPLTLGNGLKFNSGTEYDGSAAKTLSLLPTTAGGIGALAGGLRIDFDELNTVAVTTSDLVLFGDVTNGISGFPRKTTVGDILALGTAATLGNPLVIGQGLQLNTAASSYDNSKVATILIATASNGGLTISSDALKIDLDGSTLSLGAAGISVASVPNSLTQGTGISTFTFDGSSATTVAIDTTVVPRLSVNNTFSGNNTLSGDNSFSGNNAFSGKNTFGVSTTAGLTGSLQEVSAGIPYLKAGTNVTVQTASNGQVTIAASLGTGGSLTNGSGIGSFTYNGTSGATVALDASGLSQSGNRASYLFVSDGAAAITKRTVASLIDLVDRTAVMVQGTGIDITFNGNSNPATIATKLDSNTLTTDGSGNIVVSKVPNALSQGTGIKAFTFDGSSPKSVIIDNSVVATLSGSQFSGNVGITGSLEVEGSTMFRGGVTGTKAEIIGNAGVTGSLSVLGGISGSLQTLADGTAYLRAGKDILISSGSGGWIEISAVMSGGSAGGGNSDKSAQYLVLAATASLTDERVLTMGTGLRQVDGGAGNPYTMSVRNDIFAALTGSQFSGNVGITGSLEVESQSLFRAGISGSHAEITGNVGVTGSLVAVGGLSGSLQMLSDGTTPYIIGTGSITITTASSGQVIVSASDASSTVTQAGGSTLSNISTLIFTSSTVANTTAGTATITPVIGAAEDSSYADGLFTDFSYSTPIGTAVDRFNEVLKGLAPSAAPSLDDINCADSGANAKLSFGNSQSISGYTNARPSTLTPTDNLSNVDINGTFSSTTVSNDVRVACFTGTTVINGTLNADVAADGSNYNAYSFGNATQGTLKLFVNNNSTPIHSVDLSSFGSGNSLNSNNSGFNLSAATPGHFADGSNFGTFQHRQGTYTITADDQGNGWNYARVVHTIGSTDTTCNYVEWVNDEVGAGIAMGSSGDALTGLSMTGTKNLSGVKYNTAGTAKYAITITNAYRNVYSTNQITFGGSNTSVSSQNIPAIDHAGGEDETKSIVLSNLTATITGDPLLNGTISVNTSVPHPLKSNLSGVGTQSIGGILLYNLSDTSTTTSETFRGESYRISSGSYNAQANVTDAANTWNSTTSLATVDGMLFYNSRLYSPNQGGISGDFRNIADGGSLANGPSSNVNYSGISSGLRTFYRYFQNTSGGSKSNWSLTINGSGTIVSQPTTLNSSRIHVLAKLPTTASTFETGWMDLAVAFATGQTGNAAGCLDGSLDSSLNATNSGTFGTQSVGANEYIVIKIEADAAWTGYISSMSISWS